MHPLACEVLRNVTFPFSLPHPHRIAGCCRENPPVTLFLSTVQTSHLSCHPIVLTIPVVQCRLSRSNTYNGKLLCKYKERMSRLFPPCYGPSCKIGKREENDNVFSLLASTICTCMCKSSPEEQTGRGTQWLGPGEGTLPRPVHPPSLLSFEPSECMPFLELSSNVKACCQGNAVLMRFECPSLSAHPCSPVLQTGLLVCGSPASESIAGRVHSRHTVMRLLSQTTPPALNIPVQGQQVHICKRFRDSRLSQEARGLGAYGSQHCVSNTTVRPWPSAAAGREGQLRGSMGRGLEQS